MSDLCTSKCGCGCERNERSCGVGFGNNSCLWIILILLFCGGGCGSSNMSSGCDNSCLWIIILLFCCGNNNDNGCGCHDTCF